MSINYRLIAIILALCVLSVLLGSCKSSKTHCDAYGSLHWDKDIDSLSVVKDGETYMPFVPVSNAKDLHLNWGATGSYTVLLKDKKGDVEYVNVVLK